MIWGVDTLGDVLGWSVFLFFGVGEEDEGGGWGEGFEGRREAGCWICVVVWGYSGGVMGGPFCLFALFFSFFKKKNEERSVMFCNTMYRCAFLRQSPSSRFRIS